MSSRLFLILAIIFIAAFLSSVPVLAGEGM